MLKVPLCVHSAVLLFKTESLADCGESRKSLHEGHAQQPASQSEKRPPKTTVCMRNVYKSAVQRPPEGCAVRYTRYTENQVKWDRRTLKENEKICYLDINKCKYTENQVKWDKRTLKENGKYVI